MHHGRRRQNRDVPTMMAVSVRRDRRPGGQMTTWKCVLSLALCASCSSASSTPIFAPNGSVAYQVDCRCNRSTTPSCNLSELSKLSKTDAMQECKVEALDDCRGGAFHIVGSNAASNAPVGPYIRQQVIVVCGPPPPDAIAPANAGDSK